MRIALVAGVAGLIGLGAGHVRRAQPLRASTVARAGVTARTGLLEAVSRGRTRVAQGQLQVRRPDAAVRRPPVPQELHVEELELCSEPDAPHAQGWVPLRIISPAPTQAQTQTLRQPTVIFLHATGQNMTSQQRKQEEYARAGYLTAAIDCRYHGERCAAASGKQPRQVYQDAVTRAWQDGLERPFLLDNVWDLLHLLDYLVDRQDVDPERIAITGTSLGGMHSWLSAVLDPRIALCAPMIGVQGFKWALDHKQFKGRTDSLPDVFKAAAKQLGRRGVDASVVRAVWDRILPGMLSTYDAPLSLPAIAPRPLLIINGELDPRCPKEGVLEAYRTARCAYMDLELQRQGDAGKAAAAMDEQLVLHFEAGVGHEETVAMSRRIRAFIDQHLLKT